MKKGLIFDLDGTLLDSMNIWENIGEEYLEKKGKKDIETNLKNVLAPMTITEAAQYFINEYNITGTAEENKDNINTMVEDKYKYSIMLKDGAGEFLERHRNMKMCVATATDRYLVEICLERLGILKYFDLIITSGEVASSKKNPDIYLQAAKRMNLSIQECVVFEDAVHAVKTAVEAGFYTIGVYDKTAEEQEQEIRLYCNQYVKSLSEVLL